MAWTRSDFERVDPAHFPSFLAAAELENFSRAAEATASTQSGVSQHIKKLEVSLGVDLFLRDRGRVQLTDAGRFLRQFALQYVEMVDGLVTRVQNTNERISGVVKYAMPEGCLFAPHFSSLLTTRQKKFPELDVNVTIATVETIHDLVRTGQVDFGFVTERKVSEDFIYDFFVREEQVLIAKDPSLLEELKSGDIAKIPFISYRGLSDVFYLWRGVHFPSANNLTFGSLNVRGHCDSLFGVMTMVQAGVGATIIAKQCCEPLLKGKKLAEYRGKPGKDAGHDVYIVRAAETQSARVQTVIETFLEMHP